MSTTKNDNGYSLRGDIDNQFGGVTLEIVSPAGVVVGTVRRVSGGMFRVDFVGSTRTCHFGSTSAALDAMPNAGRVIGF